MVFSLLRLQAPRVVERKMTKEEKFQEYLKKLRKDIKREGRYSLKNSKLWRRTETILNLIGRFLVRGRHVIVLGFLLFFALSLGAAELTLVGISNGPGMFDSYWRSDVYFIPHGCEAPPPSLPEGSCYVNVTSEVFTSSGLIYKREDWFQDGEPVLIKNVLGLLGLEESYSTLVLHTDDPSWVEGFARTFSTFSTKSPEPTDATFGQIIPPLDPLDPQTPFILPNLSDRMNVFVFNPSTTHSALVCIGRSRWTVPPETMYFLTSSWDDLTLTTGCRPIYPDPHVDPSISLYILVSSVDNETNDPTTMLPLYKEGD